MERAHHLVGLAGATEEVAKLKPAVNVTEEDAMEMVELFGRALRDVEATL